MNFSKIEWEKVPLITEVDEKIKFFDKDIVFVGFSPFVPRVEDIINATTHRKFGKVDYVIVARESDAAKDTIYEKVEKLLVKQIVKNELNPH